MVGLVPAVEVGVNGYLPGACLLLWSIHPPGEVRMRRTTLTVGGRAFVLDPDQDVDQLQAAAVNAVKAGGATVDFGPVGSRMLSVVLSPGVPVFFETVEYEEDRAEIDRSAHPFDIDSFNYES
jgi:hypothetical protein